MACSKGFLSAFSHDELEFAIFEKTANPGLKNSGDVKNMLRNKLLRMLEVGRRASGEHDSSVGFNGASMLLTQAGSGSAAHRLTGEVCALIPECICLE